MHLYHRVLLAYRLKCRLVYVYICSVQNVLQCGVYSIVYDYSLLCNLCMCMLQCMHLYVSKSCYTSLNRVVIYITYVYSLFVHTLHTTHCLQTASDEILTKLHARLEQPTFWSECTDDNFENTSLGEEVCMSIVQYIQHEYKRCVYAAVI